MAKAVIYTRMFCPYCARALDLLKRKGVEIEERKAGESKALREEMLARSNGGRTYPQIFIGQTHIGGCDDLLALDRSGKLDPMIGAAI
jgi:glutaredoxin 3